MDIKSTAARSQNMAKIRSKNTNPEIFIRSELHKRGYRFRVNFSEIVGNPDIYFSKKQVAVFVHGCYWHRHEGCKFAYTPKSNIDFWLTKFEANKARDRVVKETLSANNIRVLVIWECTVKRMQKSQQADEEVFSLFREFFEDSQREYLEIEL